MTSNNSGKSAGGALSNGQSRAILVTALACGCISLVLVLITLRWFLIMRRCFRHRLVLHLIISDTLKAIWYFIFPIVVFTRGPVTSTSNFCQASGFSLAFALEASDMAILIIALHATLCILRPNNTIGEGGLYPYRNWIYPLWLGPPLLSASLAFVKDSDGYATAGTFCYLPKRPIWYRLALAWIPRYVIITSILLMYIWIYLYVHIKFRGFDNLRGPDSSYDTELRRKSGLSAKRNDAERRGTEQSARSLGAPVFTPSDWHPLYEGDEKPQQLQPWDHMSFVTARPLESSSPACTAENDLGDDTTRGSDWSCNTHIPPDTIGPNVQVGASKLKPVYCPDGPFTAVSQRDADDTPETRTTMSLKAAIEFKDPLRKTRLAIRKQLRYLFIYPLVYILLWSFPFAAHALNYSDYYVQNPVYWLSLAQTIALGLQAGADSVMFSFSEKPWRRVDETSRFSIPFLRRRSKAFIQRGSFEQPVDPSSASPARRQPVVHDNPSWWEAEGRRRNDSVWLGTNTISQALSSITTRTRPRSPQKQKSSLHSRTKSTEQGTSFTPRLAPILPRLVSAPEMANLISMPSRMSIRMPLHDFAGQPQTTVHERASDST